MGGGHDMDGMDGMGGGMMMWMAIWGLLGLALLVLAVTATVWLARRSDPSKHRAGPASAQELLDRRYAAGELDEEEYLRRRASLRE